MDNPIARLQSALKEPYSRENTLEAFKAIHEILGFKYINDVDFSSYDGTSEAYMKTPVHLTIDICMGQINGLLSAVAATIGVVTNSKPKKDFDMSLFVDNVADLSIVTLVSCHNRIDPLGLTGELDKKFEAAMTPSDKELCLAFTNEMNVAATLIAFLIQELYNEKAAEYFKSMTGQWTGSLNNAFATTIMIKSMQRGG